MKTLVAYVPVLHEGYRKFFTTYNGPKELYIFGPEITAEFPQLAKEIRQLEPVLMQKAIEALGIFEKVEILNVASARTLNTKEMEVVLPDEDVSRELAQKYFPDAQKIFDPIFLRWDKHNASKERQLMPDAHITKEEFHRSIIKQAEKEAEKSSDIWRHVGAAIVKNGEVVLTAYNKHLPSPHSPYANGDPRSNWSRGEQMELATGFHAEASIIAEAARRGLALDGADMYTTVFPCPPCAKIVAYSGIKNLYCGGGNSILDAEEVLKSKGVKIIFVE
ncbi:MAG: deaminase [bacterium]|nr:deaminase [bacterium]